jgi:hypothetical protein
MGSTFLFFYTNFPTLLTGLIAFFFNLECDSFCNYLVCFKRVKGKCLMFWRRKLVANINGGLHVVHLSSPLMVAAFCFNGKFLCSHLREKSSND